MSLYRISAVSELAGVSTATLRAWERRYGVPAPARTASAYRLYSDSDVQLIRRMRELVEGGMAPAEAARQLLADAPTREEPAIEVIDPYAAARDRIVEATVQFDPDALDLEVSRALALGPAVNIFDRTFGPALQRIGDLWHDGTVTIAQEHLASHVITGALSDVLRLAQPADDSRRVALACFAEEDHAVPLFGVALRFASWGFRTVMIGARTPPPAIGRVVDTLGVDVVALSTTVAPSPPRARELVDAYADACREVTWIVGGQAAESMRPWIEKRGGLVAAGPIAEIRKGIERALADRRKSKN